MLTTGTPAACEAAVCRSVVIDLMATKGWRMWFAPSVWSERTRGKVWKQASAQVREPWSSGRTVEGALAVKYLTARRMGRSSERMKVGDCYEVVLDWRSEDG